MEHFRPCTVVPRLSDFILIVTFDHPGWPFILMLYYTGQYQGLCIGYAVCVVGKGVALLAT